MGAIRTAAHGGTLGGHILLLELVPERNFAIAILTNSNVGWRLIQDVEREALKSYLGATYARQSGDRAPRPRRDASDRRSRCRAQPDPAPYVGTYLRPSNSVVVRAEGERVFVQERPNNGQPARRDADFVLRCGSRRRDGRTESRPVDRVRARCGRSRELGARRRTRGGAYSLDSTPLVVDLPPSFRLFHNDPFSSGIRRGRGAIGAVAIGGPVLRGPDRLRRHSVGARVFRTRSHDDRAGPRALLRRNGPEEERAHDDHAQLHLHGARFGTVGARRLQSRIRSGQGRADRRAGVGRAARRRTRARRVRADHSASSLHDVPADVRDHHAGAHHRRVRRANEILGVHRVCARVDDTRVRSRRALGVGGRRLAPCTWRDRLCRRNGRAFDVGRARRSSLC